METENFYFPDGRKAEKRVIIDGSKKIIEIWAEEILPMRLIEKITEKTEPVITERVIETINAQGEITERKTEALDPSINLESKEKNVENKPITPNFSKDMIEMVAKMVVDAEKGSKKISKPSIVNYLLWAGLLVITIVSIYYVYVEI